MVYITIINFLLILSIMFNFFVWSYSIFFFSEKKKNFYLETCQFLPINLGLIALTLYYMGLNYMLLPVWLTAIRVSLKNYSQFKMSSFVSLTKEDKLSEFAFKYPTVFMALLISDTIMVSIIGFILLILQCYFVYINMEASISIFAKETIYKTTFIFLNIIGFLLILNIKYKYYITEKPKEDRNLLLDFFKSIFLIYTFLYYFFSKILDMFLQAFENLFFVIAWFFISGMIINNCIQQNNWMILLYIIFYFLGIELSGKRFGTYLSSLKKDDDLYKLFVIPTSKKSTQTIMQKVIKHITEPGNSGSGGSQALRTGTAIVTGVFGGAAYYNSHQRYLNDARILESHRDTINTYAAASKNPNSGLHEAAKIQLRSFAGHMGLDNSPEIPLETVVPQMLSKLDSNIQLANNRSSRVLRTSAIDYVELLFKKKVNREREILLQPAVLPSRTFSSLFPQLTSREIKIKDVTYEYPI